MQRTTSLGRVNAIEDTFKCASCFTFLAVLGKDGSALGQLQKMPVELSVVLDGIPRHPFNLNGRLKRIVSASQYLGSSSFVLD